MFKKEIKSWIIMWITFLLTVTIWGVIYAAVTLTATEWEKITAEKWNNLLANTARLSWEIAAFNLDGCPNWWSDYTPAYGRFLRWIDKSWTNIDPDWEREKWSIQEDMLKSHSHTLNWKYYPSTWASNLFHIYDTWTHKVNSNKTWWDETRPKNVAVLYCIKD